MSIRTETIQGAFEVNDEEHEIGGFRQVLETLDIEDRDGFLEVMTKRAQQKCPANVPVGEFIAAYIDAFVAGVRTDQLTMIEVATMLSIKKMI